MPNGGAMRDFTFTALTGNDILADGDHWLGCGDSFTLGLAASASVTVRDNDARLSGDARRNETGDDRRGQIAEIEVDGAVVASDAKIYAEEIYLLRDQDGGYHWMVEIETAGAGATDRDDYYAFLGGAPLAGTELTVLRAFNVRGNWLKYQDLAAGALWAPNADGAIVVEAEHMALAGYRADDVDAASGGTVIKLNGDEGEAAVIFGAADGVYDLAVAYIDESDGQGAIDVSVNGAVVATITLDQDTDGAFGDGLGVSSTTIAGLDLAQGDVISLAGQRDGAEFARIDAVTFTPAPAAAPELREDSMTVAENAIATIDILANDSDPAGGAPTLLEAGGAAPGTPFAVTTAGGRQAEAVVSAEGVLTFEATGSAFDSLAAGEIDSFTFAYVAASAGGQAETSSVTVDVLGANDAPVAEAGSASGLVNTNIAGQLTASDPDNGAVLTFAQASQSLIGTTTVASDGSFLWRPGNNGRDFVGDVTFDFRVTDEFGATSVATATVTVNPEPAALAGIAPPDDGLGVG